MLESKFLYLIINLGTIVVPFIFSFHPRLQFYKKWKYYFPAMLITAVVFILWDEAFTIMEVWGFNKTYVTGIFIGSLPLEEVLFFFCIPYACLFTYEAFKTLLTKPFKGGRIISIVLIVISLAIAATNISQWYTTTTFFGLALVLAIDLIFEKGNDRALFFATYLILLFPFFVVNGTLTGSFIKAPVVRYNDNENLGIRLGTIPVEDIFYGMLLVLISVMIAEALSKVRRISS